MTRYDNLPIKDARRVAMQTIALAKWIQGSAAKLAKPLEEEAKQWLAENDLDPGDRKYATIDGDEVATISRSKITTSQIVEVVDEDALGEWLVANGHENPWRMRLHDWAKQPSFLEAIITAGEGEVPDGVKVSKKQTGGTVTGRQSEAQREAIENHIAALGQISERFAALAEITDGGDLA